ncbi:MAG: UDP-2,3-diacylglucosamine diphosphatase [Gammaproteobacteria bacterium]
MRPVLFASDLHLSAARPDRVEQALALLAHCRTHAGAVYLLGDLVEFWLGDDDDDRVHRRLVDALASLVSAGVTVSLTVGNRDFLVGQRFAAETGVGLLDDYTLIDLFGTPTLLTHGDLLCVKDIRYQEFRRTVREPGRQAQFLALPLAERRRIATATRTDTQKSMLDKDEYIMDVDADEVTRALSAHGARRLVHGHTHRPAVHPLDLDGTRAERVVLGDWYGAGEVYWVTAGGARLLPAATLSAELARP